jgi:hypothetical protein
VAIAHVAGRRARAAVVHDVVGLQHASMAIATRSVIGYVMVLGATTDGRYQVAALID